MRKIILAATFLMFLVGCNNECTTQQVQPNTTHIYGGVAVTCGNITDFISNGPPGTNGAPGVNGVTTLAYIQSFPQAYECGALTDAGFQTAPGTLVVMYEDNNNDQQLDYGDKIEGSYWVCSGLPGATGPQGPAGSSTPLSIVDLISPCNTPDTNNEVFLGLAGGELMAVWSDGASDTHLDEIPNGEYVTTDNTNCIFNVSGTVPGVRTLTDVNHQESDGGYYSTSLGSADGG